MKNFTTRSGLSLIGSALLLTSAAFAALGNTQGIQATLVQAQLGAVGAIDPNTETIQQRFARLFPSGGLLDVKGVLRRVYGTTFSTGTSPSDSAENFMREWSTLWKVPFSQLVKVGPFEDGAHTMPLVASEDGESTLFTAAYWRQQAMGVPVYRSYGWGLVRNEDNFPMVLAGGTLRNIGDIETQLQDEDLDASNINIGLIASQALNQFRAAPEFSTPRYVIWAGIDEDVQPARLAVEFSATGGGAFDPANHQKLHFIVDPKTGDILHQENMILQGTVTGQVNEYVTSDFKADACGAEVVRGMPYAKVAIGSTTVYADVNGAFSATYTGTGSVIVAPTLAGLYFKVADQSTTVGTVASQTIANGGSGTFLFNPTPSEYFTAQVNAYESANVARDLILAVSPNYPTIKTQTSFQINSNIADVCNAYYDGGSINFFRAGGGCNNTAFSTVVHHEFGHHMVQCAGSGQGAYGEGQADVLSVLVSDQSQLGVGFQSCSSGIRSANNNCQYSGSGCSSCGSEIHACGQLISGCVWSLRTSFIATYPSDYRTRIKTLAVNSTLLHAGSSSIANDITVDYLTLNDNDGNIGNGTPDYNAISNAFNSHGLTAPPLNLISISLPNGGPTTIDPSGGTMMNVTIAPDLSQVLAGSEKMYFREGSSGSFTAIALTKISANNYTATFPPAGCNVTAQYYIQAQDVGGTTFVLPTTAPGTTYSTTSVLSSTTVFADNFDGTSTTMIVGAPGDTATAGIWVRAATIANGCGATATAFSGAKAFITGNGACVDVDNGKTSLLTPAFSGVGLDRLDLNFGLYLNYNGASGTSDPLEVFVSNDNGQSWQLMGSYSTAQAWNMKSFDLFQFVSTSTEMKLKFVAQDNGTDNTVEAAIDSLSLTSFSCYPGLFADLDKNGTVDSGDIGLILLDVGECTGCPSDLDKSGEVDSSDVGLALLNFT